jgi:Skp family chaperone for outer membrane proteins
MKHESLTLPLVHVSKVVLFAVALAVVSPVAAFAQATPSTGETMGKIAVVDVQYLVSNSLAGKSIRDQLEKQRNSYQGQLEKQGNDLRNQEKKLAEEQSTVQGCVCCRA